MRGTGVLSDERIYGASILDVAPTVLTLLGLPVGQDMDGKVLVDAFVETPQINRIPSWEEVPGEAGLHPAEASLQNSEAGDQALQQLIDLGYVAPLSDQEKKTMMMVKRENRFNLALSLVDSGLFSEAIPLLEQLHQEHGEDRFTLMV